jgi:hypothetical protein
MVLPPVPPFSSFPVQPDRRWWHRRWLPLGAHRPELPLVALDFPPLAQCRCGWVGVDLGVYARYLGVDAGPLAGEWVWLPWRVWQRAMHDAW